MKNQTDPSESKGFNAKEYYDEKVAANYNDQYQQGLSPSNFRAKAFGHFEEKAFLNMLKNTQPGQQVLDIACGTGRYLNLLLQGNFKPGGVDISKHMLALAEKNVDRAKLLFLQQGDAEALPFPDKSFEGVTCMRLYQRVPPGTRKNMLKEVKRVGRGWAILSFGADSPWLVVRRKIRKLVLKRESSNNFPASLPQIREEIRMAGLKIVKQQWVMPMLGDGYVVYVEW